MSTTISIEFVATSRILFIKEFIRVMRTWLRLYIPEQICFHVVQQFSSISIGGTKKAIYKCHMLTGASTNPKKIDLDRTLNTILALTKSDCR